MTDKYLQELNKAQREAVINTEGPALVIAGPGAGKTRVLTYRVAYLLGQGTRADKILALTFTNKAAREMKDRITRIAGSEIARFLWMGTFHSIFARILRIEGEKLGYKSSYTIYDSSDSRSLIRAILRELSLDDDIYKPGVIAGRISYAKNNLITSDIYAGMPEMQEYDKASRMPLLSDIYTIYSARCFKSNAMDFDDLLLNTNILLRDFPEVLSHYQGKFKYILVDEYQDTNFAQYLIIKKLASAHHNICVVGDDSQSIYSFRGARLENILEFKNDYPDYSLFKLEQNYRSTQIIVNAANDIIAYNSDRIQKTVYSRNEKGEKIRVMQAMTDTEEGIIVISDMFDTRFSQQLKWSDFAILYRTNAQSRIFEETLRKRNIPYRIYGGLSFYERKEIKDILAYFRVVINPGDEEALKRTINYPKRGIGETTLYKILEIASATGSTAWSVLLDIDNQSEVFNAGTRKRICDYRDMISGFALKSRENNAYVIAKEIVMGSGIMKELREGKTPEEVSRLENLEELMNAVKEFTEAAEANGEPDSLDVYLQNVALLTDQDNEDDEALDKVTLMTMHSAKGLEFSHVYITGMEDTLFPSPLSTGNPKDLEEERRLFYVAVTRAEKLATLTYADNRYKWGRLEHSHPSRFLRELDQAYVDYPQTGRRGYREPFKISFDREHFSEKKKEYKAGKTDSTPKKNLTAYSEDISSFRPEDPYSFSEGDNIIHERFGKGIIILLDGSPPNTTALVEFEDNGRKKLLLRFARLKKL